MAFLTEAGAFFAALPYRLVWAADPGLLLQAAGPACETATILRAVEKRQREFRSGRNLARQVLAELGYPGVALPSDQRRKPRWPDGLRGSITHCDDLAIAVAGRGLGGVGVDVEPATNLPSAVDRHVMTTADREAAVTVPPIWPTVVFCAKEAFYKATSHRLPFIPDFDEAAICPQGEAGFRVVALSRRLQETGISPQIKGYWTRTRRHLIAVAVLPAEAPLD